MRDTLLSPQSSRCTIQPHRLLPALAALFLVTAAMPAQNVVLLSDIHLDPFHDPAKFSQLNAAPAEQWSAILNSAPSATQAADYAALQKACKAKGIDTPAVLLTS